MAIGTRGFIVFDSISPTGTHVQLDTDPKTYKRTWPRRQSTFEGLGGSVTKQDFGRFAKDMTIKLESQGQWLNLETVKSLLTMAGQRGKRFRFQDGEDNDFTVTIESFDAWQAQGVPELYEYDMELRVFGITTLLGVTYTGD